MKKVAFFVGLMFLMSLGMDLVVNKTRKHPWIENYGPFSLSYISEMTDGHKTVVLIGMVHMAQKDFYQEIYQYMDGRNFIALKEGLTDKAKLSKIPHDYQDAKGITALYGIVGQGKTMKAWDNEVLADWDLSDFSKICQDHVRIYLNDQDAANIPKPTIDCDGEVIDGRNYYVFNKTFEYLKKWDTVAIPWGASHLPGLKELFESRGFREVKRTPVVFDSSFHRVRNAVANYAAVFQGGGQKATRSRAKSNAGTR